MSLESPFVVTRSFAAPPVATVGNDANNPATEAPFDGTVTAVTYTPATTITGANTNTRSVSLVNKKADGTGTAVVATLQFDSGVNAAANIEKVIPLSGTPANLVVAAEDQLIWQSTHVGTGIADPGGRVEVTFARS